MNEIKAHLWAEGLRIGIVVARMNEGITRRLLDGALDALFRHGAKEEDVDIIWVPGSFEIPYALSLLAKKGKHNGLIALGCVTRGETQHNEFIAQEAIKGIQRVMDKTGMPIGLGILTVDSTEQGIERAGGKRGNKGSESALSVIELIRLNEKIQ